MQKDVLWILFAFVILFVIAAVIILFFMNTGVLTNAFGKISILAAIATAILALFKIR